MRNTRFLYQYTNKSNLKKAGSFVVSGQMTEADAKIIAQSLRKGLFFIPSQVGIASIAGNTEDDHVWHTLDLSLTSGTMERPTLNESGEVMTVSDLVEKFSTTIWNPSAETSRMYEAGDDGRNFRLARHGEKIEHQAMRHYQRMVMG